MSSSSADTNLLFGILALQLDFISRDQLVEGMHAWVLNKSQSLGAVLVEKAHLAPDRRALLDALVQEHLKQHQGDAEKSLAALSAVETSVQKDLERLCDSQLNASLKTLSISPALSPEPNATGVVTVGFPTSSAGRFRILRPHARGGLGQVSIAYDEELNREVALKEIQPEHAGCAESQRRFVQEAEVTGSLEHPGIVPVYGMGTYADGRPFYAMRFIAGNSLKKAIHLFHQQRDPQIELDRDPELNHLLGRFLDVCNAMEYAHSKGVLHRDLKPGNIMLGKFGETLVVDWGLAKRLNHHDKESDPLASTLFLSERQGETLPGSAVGTPEYMSPEQASGDIANLGPLTDVYSLGAILFEIITSKPPHEGKDTFECLRAAAQNVIVPTNQSGELIEIAHRAMSTLLEDRFQSVGELINAVRDYLTHRDSIAIATLAESDLGRARLTKEPNDYAKARFRFEEALKLWDQNKRAKAGLKSVQIEIALEQEKYNEATSLLDPFNPSDEDLRAKIRLIQAERESRQKRLNTAKRAGWALLATLFLVVSGAAFWINIERSAAIAAKDDAIEARDDAKKAEAEAVEAEKIAVAAKEREEGLRNAADQAAGNERRAKIAEQEAKAAAILAQKEAEHAAEAERMAKVEEVKAKNYALIAAEAERKTKLVAIEAKLAEEREAYFSKVGLAAAKIKENDFDAARDLLLSTNPRFRNWEWGYLMHLCEGYVSDYKSSQRLEAGALIGDGEEFVVAGHKGLVEIRKTDDPKTVVEVLPTLGNVTVYDVAVSPNSNLIALATDDARNGFIKIWDRRLKAFAAINFGSKSASFDSTEDYFHKHETSHMDPVVSVQFSHDGAKLLTASQDQSARVWDVETGRQLVRLFGANSLGHTGYVWDASFFPNLEMDGSRNFVLGEDKKPKAIPETKVVTASEDGTVRIWVDETGLWNDASAIKPLPAFREHRGPVYSVAVSPDGEYVASGGYDDRVLLWHPDDLPQFNEDPMDNTANRRGFVRQTLCRQLLSHEGPIRSLAFAKPASEDFRDLVLLTASDDNTIKIWIVNKEGPWIVQEPIRTFRGHGGYVRDAAFNPEGTWILSVSHDRTAKRWSLDEGANTEVYLANGTPVDGHRDNVDAVGFSFAPESKNIVTASRDNTAQVFTIEGENRLKPLYTFTEGHEALISSGVYFDEGKKLATAAADNTVRVWDILSGTEIHKLEGTGYMGVVAVSPKTPKGHWILTASDNPDETKLPWQAKLWDAKTGTLVATFGDHKREVTAAAFANNVDAQGKLLIATADAGGRCSMWAYTPGTSEVVAVLSPQRFDNGNAHNDRIIALSFLPDDSRLLSASYDNAVSQWDVATGKATTQLDLKHPQQVTSMDLSEDGKLVVTTCFDGVVRLWNLESARIVQEFRAEGRVSTLIANISKQFAAQTPANNTLKKAWTLINPEVNYEEFLAKNGWNQSVDQLLTQIPKHVGAFKAPPRELAQKLSAVFEGVSANDLLLPATSSVAISPDNHYIVATNRADRIAHGWYFPGNSYDQPVAFLIDDGLDVWSAAFSPAKIRTDLVVLGFSDARQWKLSVTPDNSVRATASITLSAQGQVASASFSSNGEYLVTGTADKAARVWSVKTGRGLVKLQGQHTAPVNAAIWAPKSLGGETEQYVLTASDDATAVLWKLVLEGTETLKVEIVRVFKGHSGPVTGAAFSPDGAWIVTVSEDQTIRLWNSQTGDQVVSTEPQGGALLCVAFCGDGKRILTGSANNQAMIWNIARTKGKTELKPILALQGHSAPVTDVAFSPGEDLNGDGQITGYEGHGLRAVTASRDNSVIVWDTRVPTVVVDESIIPGANQVLTLKRHNRPVKAVRFSPDGRYILTGSEDHRAILWPTKDWMADKQRELRNVPSGQ